MDICGFACYLLKCVLSICRNQDIFIEIESINEDVWLPAYNDTHDGHNLFIYLFRAHILNSHEAYENKKKILLLLMFSDQAFPYIASPPILFPAS